MQYGVTATPSKNPYNCVNGLHLVTLNSMFLERIVIITSRLTTLSPRDSLSNCSVTTFLVPFLDWWSILNVSRIVSCNVVVVVVVTSCEWLTPDPPLIQPALIISSSVVVLVSVLLTLRSEKSCPLQLVSHEFHCIGAIPVCGSTPNSCIACAIMPAKLPSCWIIFASSLAVSVHVSVDGFNLTVDCQKLTKNGVTLSVLVANCWLNHSVSVYERVTTSSVFLIFVPSAARNARSVPAATPSTGPGIRSIDVQ